MARPSDDSRPPMAEPGSRASGASTGGIASNADGGLQDALQRSSERGDDDATGGVTTGEASSGGTEPRLDLGGKNEPGSADGAPVPVRPPRGSATARQGERPVEGRDHSLDDGRSTPRERSDAKRPAAEPPDEGPLESLGRSISEPLAGAEDPGVPGSGSGADRRR